MDSQAKTPQIPSKPDDLPRRQEQRRENPPQVRRAKPQKLATEHPPEPLVDPKDVIGDRDQVFPLSVATQSSPLAITRAFVWDLICCLCMNLVILKTILWVSPRSFSEMLRFSLIPLLFVLLCFTVLYFWLFLGFFQTTLGGLIADQIHRRTRK